MLGTGDGYDPACPTCGSASPQPAAGRLANCSTCSHSWLPVTATAQKAAEQAIYQRHYPGYKADPRLDDAFGRLIESYLAPVLPAGSAILDVGCGGGAFLQAARVAGYEVRGIDVSEDAAQLCRERGHNAEAADFLSYGEPSSVGAITMWDVLEHLRNPVDFLKRAATLLAPGGVLLAKVPTYGRLSIRIADHFPRGRGALLGAPDHIQYYNPGSLSALLERSGLEFTNQELATQGMRTAPTGGSVKRRFMRQVKTGIASVSGEGNQIVFARKR